MYEIEKILNKIEIPEEIKKLLKNAKRVYFASEKDELYSFIFPDNNNFEEIKFQLPDGRIIVEATVTKVKNGVVVNYPDSYMRRRDPNSMLIGDNIETDKTKFEEVYNYPFEKLRKETFEYLKSNELLVYAFIAGGVTDIDALCIVPKNCAFFAYTLSLLQGIIDIEKLERKFKPKTVLYLAPPFRITHFEGKQRVVHNKKNGIYEIFSYNLYPGPSAKKGIYGALLHFGEIEGYLTNHASAVQVITPYNNRIVIMHEAASGGGKSEINEHLHREEDGSILLGKNIKTGEERYIFLPRGCRLKAISDDMTLCHPSFQRNNGRLTIFDAEESWFIRVDHIKSYGIDPDIEKLSIHPPEPLVFFNIDAPPNSTALLWEHVEDEPGKPCPNPRVVIPRKLYYGVVNKPLSVHIRSFGLRTPPCSSEQPTYGILGLFHILPPAIAFLWRLAAPRGHANPSIIDTEGMQSEGVGTFWPFASGKKVNFANLLLKQIVENPKTHYILVPIKHIGVWEVGFMPEWIMREYIARRNGCYFLPNEITRSKCVLLGYTLKKLVIERQEISPEFLDVARQPEVGEEAFLKGSQILYNFFEKQLKQYYTKSLHPVAKQILECFFDKGSLKEFESIVKSETCIIEE